LSIVCSRLAPDSHASATVSATHDAHSQSKAFALFQRCILFAKRFVPGWKFRRANGLASTTACLCHRVRNAFLGAPERLLSARGAGQPIGSKLGAIRRSSPYARRRGRRWPLNHTSRALRGYVSKSSLVLALGSQNKPKSRGGAGTSGGSGEKTNRLGWWVIRPGRAGQYGNHFALTCCFART